MPNSDRFRLDIVSPTGIIFDEEIDSVSMPTPDGTITVLAHHTPLFTKLADGEVDIKRDGKTTTIVISGGFCEIKKNIVNILSDYAIRAESIQIAKSEERKRQAEEKLKGKLDNEEFTVVDKDLRLSILELKAAEKMKKRQRVN
ncbi:MAG TPA: ATP synthase F1 subunit epsilon [Patescibacteria group bacterium]|nr:ATP synthase F1 subunit epsilon [Patescibacteria group bacterium]